MSMFFSESLGFTEKRLSDNQVEITDDEWIALIEGQSAGKVITEDENGKPYLAEPPGMTHADLVAIADKKKKSLLSAASTEMQPLQDAVDLDIATDDEKALLTAWKTYRVMVNRVDTNAAPDITWPKKPE